MGSVLRSPARTTAVAASLAFSASQAARAAANASCVLTPSSAVASAATLVASSSLASAAVCADLARSVASGVLAVSTALVAASSLARAASTAPLGIAQRRDRPVGLRRSCRRDLGGFLGRLGLGRSLGDDLSSRCLGPLERIEELDRARRRPCDGVSLVDTGTTADLAAPVSATGTERQGGGGQALDAPARGAARPRVPRRRGPPSWSCPTAPKRNCAQPDTAMRGRIARQDARMHGHARPRDALHEGHRRATVDVRAVVPVLLDHAEDTGRGRKARHSRRDGVLRVKAACAVDAICAAWGLRRRQDAPGARPWTWPYPPPYRRSGRPWREALERLASISRCGRCARPRRLLRWRQSPRDRPPADRSAVDATESVGKSLKSPVQLQLAACSTSRKTLL